MTGRPPAPQILDGDAAADAPRWVIRPEPSDEELVALMTVLTLRREPAAEEPARIAPAGGSRWARAGRAAAVTAWPPPAAPGWGRRR